MEDVVLHYRSGSAEGLGSLLETSEKLLEPFPCRPPPVFTCWFPAAADRHRPIRPVKPAPVITFSDVSLSKPPLENQSESRTAGIVAAETQKPKGGISEEQTSPVRRSWSVFRQTEVLLQSSESMSRRFLHMVSVNKLHLRQRAKWVIREQNFETRDIEQVWRTLIRSVRSSSLPSFNANIQRQRAEIWVFCDVLNGEQVGRHLKEQLQLKGRISLSVRRLGNVFSL
ncbi:shieldin complex subunit 3 [Acanthochromis polyacanthus]|uniref:Zgc:101664 n=1 Tax=Acanthochromis polyacanthus TaxID=80966 RepID=A0A3Q1EDS0_9TELE|nr:shieldin complex subunit 3 [Acanthochromis polyacanthus]XP_022068479.1 shieldin complex subunit 3 [Acanthochromis polyacanthus]